MGYSPFRAHRLSFEILMAENKEGKVQEGQGQGLGAVFGCSLRAGAHRWVLSYRGEVIPELAEAGHGGDVWQDGALRRRAGGRLARTQAGQCRDDGCQGRAGGLERVGTGWEQSTMHGRLPKQLLNRLQREWQWERGSQLRCV